MPARRAWTPEEIVEAESLREQGLSYSSIAREIGRARSSVSLFFREAGRPHARQLWTEQEDNLLRQLRDSGTPWQTVAKKLGRSADACRNRFAAHPGYLPNPTPPVRRAEASRAAALRSENARRMAAFIRANRESHLPGDPL
jgi:transposase